jgi:hypothetical protein
LVQEKLAYPHIELRYQLLIICEDFQRAGVPRKGEVMEYAVRWASIAVILDSE